MTNHSVIVEVEFVVEQCARASESSLGRQQADTDQGHLIVRSEKNIMLS